MLSSLPHLRSYRSRRASSWAVDGTNRDFWRIEPGETREIFREDVPGCVRHIWMTVGGDDLHPRKTVLRFWWDGEKHPSVEAPIGDFFGLPFGRFKNLVSLPLQCSPQDGRAYNCWFPMPFDAARMEVRNEGEHALHFYFYIDWEEYEFSTKDQARFHAQWRRENPTQGWIKERITPENVERYHGTPNLSDEDNYLILEAEGSGAYVGCNLQIDAFERHGNDWYGEGDDMIVIDGEPWPPRLHGTGTEDYFNTAWGPTQEYQAPFHGITMSEGDGDWPWRGKNAMYRFHILDPIRFERSIRVSIEHGHANKLTNDYASTAYWYQMEPHRPFPALPEVEERMPR
jgi:hypothetical protein